jgi:hypothetical protein
MARREDMKKKVNKPKDSKKGSQAKEVIQDIPPEKYFVLRSGSIIKSLDELAHNMDRISDEDFSFHVNDGKNDFANWIRDVFGRSDLADSMVPVKDKKGSQIVLLKHVASKSHA